MRVALVPTPLEEGWESMNHHWASLQNAFGERPEVVSLLGQAELGKPAAGKLKRALNRKVLYPRLIKRAPRCDVYHILDHSYAELMEFVPRGAKVVVTVHDLIPLIDPSVTDDAMKQRFTRRVERLKQADRLVCVSEFTAGEVKRLLNVNEDRIRVLPMGVDEEYLETRESSASCKTGPQKILVVGSALPRKNLEILPQVVKSLKAEGRKFELVKAGHKFPIEIGDELRSMLGKDELKEVGFVSPEELRDLYSNSRALFFPSFLEGFGLPVLEAMAAGCPVVCSDQASLPEVGGDAVLYFDPKKPEEGARALGRLLDDSELREELSRAGQERARGMVWRKHAEAMWEIYREVMG